VIRLLLPGPVSVLCRVRPRRLALIAMLVWLGGCQAGYYGHLARGHLDLMASRQPVVEVLAGDELDPHQRHLLMLSDELLAFASDELALPAKGVYRHYVPLERDWVVWNLFAAPPYSLNPHTWCYPVAGCAGYRGFFQPSRARREQRRLEAKGLEVYGAGAIAYSTLGWFRDPLTSAMLQGDDLWFAELLFHELAHRRFYLKGDTRFNESLATAVAREGVRRWLAARGEPERMQQLQQRDQARASFLALVAATRQALAQLYGSGQDIDSMAAGKVAIVARLREDYAEASKHQPGLRLYRDWFDGPLNNAQLNMVSDYHDQVPLFDAALLACGGDWSCFWREVKRLSRLSAPERTALNEALHD
jgi:predicted aminopeptidase